MSNVQVLHIEKRDSIAGGLNRHITRVQWVDGQLVVWVPCNADPEKTKNNVELVSREIADLKGNKKTLSLQQAVDKRIKEAGIKPRKNQSKCLEMIFSGSQEVMCNMSREEVLAWANDTLVWAQETWGKENVVGASLHVDEKTPHIHMIVVPIVKGQSRRSKKQKELDKERGVARDSYKINHDKLRLCCNEVYTTPLLYFYHDHYAKEVSNKYGLERGLRAEPGSKKKHQTSEDYNRQLAAEAQEKRSLIKELQADYKTTKEKTEEAQKQQKEAEDRKAVAEQQAVEKEKKVKELEGKTSSLSVEISNKETRITELDTSIEEKARDEHECWQIKDALERYNEKLTSENQTLEETITQNKATIKAQEKKIKASSVIREDAIDKVIAEKMISVAALSQEETRLSRSVTDKKTALAKETANLQRVREQIGVKVYLDNIPKEGAFGYKTSEVKAFIESVEYASLKRAMNNAPSDIDVNQDIRSEVDRLRRIEDEHKTMLQSKEQLQEQIRYLETEEKRQTISEMLKYALQKAVNVISFTVDKTEEGEDIFVRFTKEGNTQQFACRITPSEYITYTSRAIYSLQDCKDNWEEAIWTNVGYLGELQQKREREDLLSRYSSKLTKLLNKKISVTDYEKGEDGRILLFSGNGRAYEVGSDGKTWSTSDGRVKSLADCKKYSQEKIWTNEGDINNPVIIQKGKSM